jgi:uncharacterized ferritin-like protein (DUF455 family)
MSMLRRSRSIVSTLLYLSIRSLRSHCAWITSLQTYEDKIECGLRIGRLGRMVEGLDARHREMHGANAPPPAIGSAYALDKLSDAARAPHAEIMRHSDALLALIAAGLEAASTVVDATYDERTWLLIASARRDFPTESDAATPVDANPHDLFATDREWTIHTGTEPMPALEPAPLRPDALILGEPPFLPAEELLATEEGIRRLIHFVYCEIEVPAAEVCARNIAEYGAQMPLQFTLDMARQVHDEARHAVMARDMLAKRRGRLGEFPYRNFVWTLYAQGRDLSEKIVIEQLIGEGNGLDMSEHCMDLFRARGMSDMHDYYSFLQMDEVNHCAYGNRWLRYLCGGDDRRAVDVVERAREHIGGTIPGPASVRLDVRRAAEFSDAFIDRYLRQSALEV